MRKLFTAAFVVALVAPAAVRAADKDIVDVAVENKDFSTLVAAVKAAGLVDALKAKGPITVFAPTNAAFEKLGKEKLEAVLKDKELLTKILKAHVVEGKVMAATVVGMDGKMVNGFKISATAAGVMLGDAKVVKTDIETSNGVIHVIDTVLIPSSK
ncbi:MAG: fasciclin domain-containing protein [Fimbriiglobus sp.]